MKIATAPQLSAHLPPTLWSSLERLQIFYHLPLVSAPPLILSQTSPSSVAAEGMPEPSLSKVKISIKINQSDLMGKVEELKLDLSIICQNMHKIRERVISTEQCISEILLTPLLPNVRPALQSSNLWGKRQMIYKIG